MSFVETSPRVLDGIAVASQIKMELQADVTTARESGYMPGLAVILVGDVAASQIYVRSKVKTCAELGIYSEMHTPAASTTTEELLLLVDSLNRRDEIDGILIQLPLPSHVDTARLLEAVIPAKDVDGFHPINAGRLLSGFPPDQVLAPCTPAGIMEVLQRSGIKVAGQRAVVLGRSNIVGKPAAAMLINASATVTVCHSQTRDLGGIAREADILVAAIGRPGFVTPDMVKPGATLIDVGINRLTTQAELDRYFPAGPANQPRRDMFAAKGSTIVGDVDPAAFALSGAYTPVPGGVGALTIAMLMSNTVKAARMRRG
jgi:methylenetetrahydrofolate dehydrogenase (NADP+)/methenyltetrahydrofolate cyclohydrolase